VSVTYLDPDHRVVRYVPWAKLRKDENDKVIGVLGAAFKLRAGESYLSATWAEYFKSQDQVRDAIKAIRSSNINVKPKSGFAVGSVVRIDKECKARKVKLRFVHEPAVDNPAHTAIRGWPQDDDELFETLALNAWNDTILNSAVP
jgi:hypothetical protein